MEPTNSPKPRAEQLDKQLDRIKLMLAVHDDAADNYDEDGEPARNPPTSEDIREDARRLLRTTARKRSELDRVERALVRLLRQHTPAAKPFSTWREITDLFNTAQRTDLTETAITKRYKKHTQD